MHELDRQNRLYFPSDKDGRIRLKRYLDETPGQIAQNLWSAAKLAIAAMKEGKSEVYEMTKSKDGIVMRLKLTKYWKDWVVNFDYFQRKEIIKVGGNRRGWDRVTAGREAPQGELAVPDSRSAGLATTSSRANCRASAPVNAATWSCPPSSIPISGAVAAR